MWTSWPRAATPWAIGSMNVPTVSPENRGYNVATITTISRIVQEGRRTGPQARGPVADVGLTSATRRSRRSAPRSATRHGM